jgi:hypothetical protein
MLSPLRVDQREATVVQRDRRSVRCLCLRRLRLRLALSNSTAKTALNHCGLQRATDRYDDRDRRGDHVADSAAWKIERPRLSRRRESTLDRRGARRLA